MAKGPAKKSAKKPARPVSKASPKPTVKKATATKAKPVKSSAKPAKAAKPAPVATRQAPMNRLPPPPPMPAPISAVLAPTAAAVVAFERGMNALHLHDYKTASSTFQTLLAQFPSEGFLGDRARVYLELATRELRKKSAGDGSVEERLTTATLALNNNNDDEAVRLATDVLKEDSSQDLAAYLLAVVASRRGDVNGALEYLRTAIGINPECRLQARQDEEFDPLMDSDEFHALIEAPSSSGTTAAAALGKKPVRKIGR